MGLLNLYFVNKLTEKIYKNKCIMIVSILKHNYYIIILNITNNLCINFYLYIIFICYLIILVHIHFLMFYKFFISFIIKCSKFCIR